MTINYYHFISFVLEFNEKTIFNRSMFYFLIYLLVACYFLTRYLVGYLKTKKIRRH